MENKDVFHKHRSLTASFGKQVEQCLVGLTPCLGHMLLDSLGRKS